MWLIKYNKFYDALLCSSEIMEHDRIVEKNNIILLYKNDNLIGVNIFGPKIDKQKKYRLFDPELNKYLITVLNQLKVKSITINDGFLISKILEVEDIENTHLKKCVVDIKTSKIQIVTNAKNVYKDMITVVATPGTVLGDGTLISDGKIKSIISNGMFCSAKTLEVEDIFENLGVIELPRENSSKIGQGFFTLI